VGETKIIVFALEWGITTLRVFITLSVEPSSNYSRRNVIHIHTHGSVQECAMVDVHEPMRLKCVHLESIAS
jgi:hypothetical protein